LTAETGAANSRRGARDLLVQALYQWQLAGHSKDDLHEQFEQQPEFSHIDKAYFRAVLDLVLDGEEEFDLIIARLADRALQQLDAIGRGILLLALAELAHRPDVPSKVIINEAVELAKRYGASESYRFVNAVLDKAAKEFTDRNSALTG